MMIESLDQISTCWQGQLHARNSTHTSSATKYVTQLRVLYKSCSENAAFQVDVLGYTNESTKSLRKNTTQPRSDYSNTELGGVSHDQSTYARNPHNSSQVTDERRPSQHVFSSPPNQSEQTSSLPLPVSRTDSYYYGQVSMNSRAGNIIPSSYPIPPAGAVVMNDAQAAMDDYNVDLNSISQMFFDQQYIDMDRVISFDDGMFNADMNYGVNMNS